MKLYVNINTAPGGCGTQDKPFRSIQEASQIAQPGDEILVAPGIYREYVDPIHAGTEDAPITYRSTEPLGAHITGAEPVKNWTFYQDNVWFCRVSNEIFGDYNPYTTFVYGDWYFAKADKHTGCVYLNDRALYETATLEECIKGDVYECSWVPEESVYKWYTEQDTETNETIIYANFQGKNPNEENVEINVRRMCFFPSKTGVSYITVSGFAISKAATTWAPPAAFQDGMIGPHWSKGWIIEDCDISNSKCSGISLGKYLDPENDHFFTYQQVKSPTQMERDAVCRGQYHGWLKENVGSHIIRRNNIHHSTMGIWCDWEAQGTRLTQNLLHDNQLPPYAKMLKGGMMCQDIFIEVSHGPTLIDHNIMLSEASVRFATQGVALVHNLICGALTDVGRGTTWRYTPYHMPHRTEVMGFMTILHGDNRFYNNIFWPSADVIIPHGSDDGFEYENRLSGTWMFDEYPTYDEWISQFDFTRPANMKKLEPVHFSHLPVWSEGNVYLSGAKACKNEVGGLVFDDDVRVELAEKDGCCYLDTNIYDLLKDFTVPMVHTDTLGKAFEPAQKFENPDGSPITFNLDYFDLPRDCAVVPGPFASAAAAAKQL